MDDASTTTSHRRGSVVRAATLITVGALAVLGYLGHGRHVVHVRPGGAVFDDQILPTCFLLFLASALLAIRWPLVGGVVATFTVAGMVPFAINQLEPWSTMLLLVVFTIPAVVWTSLGLASRPRSPHPKGITRRQVISTITGVAIAAVGGSIVGRYIYDRIWGPTHPESTTPRLHESLLDWFWCGAVTATGCVVRVRPRIGFVDARLLIAAGPELEGARAVPFSTVFDRVVEFRVDELAPGTRYTYAVEIDDVVDAVRTGTFRTFPDQRTAVRLVFASCARIGSNGAVFDAIRDVDPLLYVCIGDFHYGDNFVDDVDDYRQVFDVQLTQPAQAALYASTPIGYMWDDHDYGPDDSDRNAPGRAAAMTAYREYVPHYDLARAESAIFQSFSLGTVRVILTDARSARDPHVMPDEDGKSMLGAEQRDWLLDELVTSADDHDVVIWVNPVPWVGEAEEGGDSWAGYTHERSLIASHIADHGIDNLLMVSGDAHMVAIDDGTHTNYSDRPGPGFALVHVAALDRPGSTKGGPYTLGPIAGGGQFAIVEIVPGNGGSDVDLTAMNWKGERLLHHRVTLPYR